MERSLRSIVFVSHRYDDKPQGSSEKSKEDKAVITSITVRNFKRFEDVTIPLDSNVVLIGPNNFGKSSVLQALALWDVGYREWHRRRGRKRSSHGVTINRRDMITLPVPTANLLWRDLQTRSTTGRGRNRKTQNIRIDLVVEGADKDGPWTCGFEFDYANPESFYCRPLRLENGGQESRHMEIPDLGDGVNIAFLPPMSGLADREYLKQPGEIGVLLGQGQTAQVLRNLCWQIYSRGNDKDEGESTGTEWAKMTEHMKKLFRIELLEPKFNPTMSEITMTYRESRRDGRDKEFDLSSAGRGLQQTLLLLAHLYAKPRSTLLLDEPDAHLEIIRQRQVYNLICEVARQQHSQVVVASHSEVILREAAGKGTSVVALLGQPHVVNDRGSQLRKALETLSYEEYYQALQKGWILYLEGPTDLAILQAFARLQRHAVEQHLSGAFVRYVENNNPKWAREHFHGLREANPNLVGFALFDRISKPLQNGVGLVERMWKRNEIENYFCDRAVLMAYAAGPDTSRMFEEADMFEVVERETRIKAMEEAIEETTQALRTLENIEDPWSVKVKASERVLGPVFRIFAEKTNNPLILRKGNFYELVPFVTEPDPEIAEKLDLILKTAEAARPA